MKSEKYYNSHESAGDQSSYQKQSISNYDNYRDDNYNAMLAASNHYNLKLGALEENLEPEYESEYDENDWEEESEDDLLETEETDEEPGTFLM